MSSRDDRDSDDDLAAGEPPVIDPYEVLGLDRAATAEQVRAAYRKAALRSHPDKVAPEKRAAAHEQFQAVALAYAVLSDPARRARYDTTGSTAASVVDSDGFSWSDFYRAAFAESVSAEAIAALAATYKGSDEERDDVLAAYTRCQGDLDGVYESVLLSNVLEDDARFRGIIDAALAAGAVRAFPAYTRETAAAKRTRVAAAQRESREAEEYAKELGVHDKLFGQPGADKKTSGKDGDNTKTKGKGKGKGKKTAEDDQAGLAALIQRRQQDRAATFLDDLAAKYGTTAGPKKKKSKKSAKRHATDEDDEEDEDQDEPSEEAFQAAAARLKNGGAKSAKSAKKARR
ncbi:beta-glucanase [Niveomyces insectorum RCEF 264]|uniref:Beta-glucanase n=1 Tax=Niveomyces insectorum RCEF 264 TaxID=1081102 RepID=A0A167WV53_9HYPO|nr:beta-glucanase [Niveomyces insectorum RCEF 264]